MGKGLLLERLVQMPLWASALGVFAIFSGQKFYRCGQVVLHREQNQRLLVLSAGNNLLRVLNVIKSLFA